MATISVVEILDDLEWIQNYSLQAKGDKKMARILKKITIEKFVTPVVDCKRIEHKTFRSFKAIAGYLEPGEIIICRVMEYISGSSISPILAGFGQVERTEDGWVEPRRLLPEY